MNATPLLLEFVYTAAFERTAKGLLSPEDLRAMEGRLLENPRAGVVEAETGGVRKIRVPLPGRGKSGGARVIYYYRAPRSRIYLLLAFPKSMKESLSAGDRKRLREIVAAIEKEE